MLTGVDLKVRILYIGKTKLKKFFKTTYYNYVNQKLYDTYRLRYP